MINYGNPPASDVVEVTLFGPGYGEALALHLGDNTWMLVDSCIDPESNQPAANTYLDQLRVGFDRVRTIVASHWHDDHIGGMARLSEKYAAADLVISTVFSARDSAALLAAYSGETSSNLGRGSKELYGALKTRSNPYYAHHRSIVLEATLGTRRVLVTALSPTPAAMTRSVAHFAQYLPRAGAPINNIPDLSPNHSAVVLHVDLDGEAVLLGADLENHGTFGWPAVVGDSWTALRRKASIYKVAHHGSESAHNPQIWTVLLEPESIACVAPFTRGNVRLPTDADRARIRAMTHAGYLTSEATRRPEMDARILKRMSATCRRVTRVNNGFGAVRFRRRIGAGNWSVDLFGSAVGL